LLVFAFTAPPTTAFYTLSLHDALPISMAAVLHSVYWSVSELLGFSRSGLLRGDVPERLLVLLVVTGLGCLAGGLRLTINWSALRALAADACASLSLIYVVGTVAFIVMAAKSHASGVFMS